LATPSFTLRDCVDYGRGKLVWCAATIWVEFAVVLEPDEPLLSRAGRFSPG